MHFCNKISKLAITVKPTVVSNNIVAPIPNSLLQDPYPIIAYFYVPSDNGSRTIVMVTIPIEPKKRPSDFILNEDEAIASLDAINNKVNTTLNNITVDYNDFKVRIEKELQDTVANLKLDDAKTLQSHPASDFVLKVNLPTSLPANGGNADTVDGYHIRCEDVATPNYNWFATFDNDNLSGISPERAYVGNANTANSIKTLSVIGTASDCTHSTILEWANSIVGFGTACVIQAYGYPSDLPLQQEGMLTVETCYQKSRKIITFASYTDIGLVYQRSIYNNEWRSDWYQIKTGNADYATNAGNANTVGGARLLIGTREPQVEEPNALAYVPENAWYGQYT